MQLDRTSVGGVFVGRESELAAVHAALEEAMVGRGRLLLLGGEPGIGKTRTCEEVATYASRRGARVLWGRCYEGEGAPAFWPWVQIIRSAITHEAPEALRELLGSGGSNIGQVVPQLRERLPDLPVLAGLDSETARARLFASLAQFLANLARRTPLVLIIDDLQGADRSSLLLLQFVARELRQAPVLLMGSYRPAALAHAHPLADLLAELAGDPANERIDLHGLSEAELAHFMAVSIGHTTPADFVAALHRQTEGTPLFVKEFIQLLLSGGDAERLASAAAWNIAVPQTVTAMIGRRLATLPTACSDLLAVGAVIGREFRVDVLEAAASRGRSTDEPGPGTSDVLAEAVAAHIIVEVPDSPGRYRFAHALFRETLYGELSMGQRVRLHRQVGEAIQQLPDSEEYLAELAYHLFEAGRDGDNAQAIAYAQRAGDRALALLAYEEAARLYQLGLDALGRSAGAESQRDATQSQEQHCALLLALGRARRLAGEVSKAKEIFLEAVNLARQLQAAEPLARAVLGFGCGDSSSNADPLFMDLLEEALRILSEEDSVLRVQVQGALANQFLRILDKKKEGARLSREALAMARRVGHPRTLCDAFVHWYYTDYRPENLQERLAGADEVVRLGERIGDPTIVLDGLRLRVPSFMELGDMPAMERDIEAYAQAAEVLRQTLYSWRVPLYRSAYALLQGRFEEAERLGLEMLAIGQQAEEPEAVMLFSALLFSIRGLQGRLDELPGLDAAAQDFLDQYSWNSAWRAGVIYGYVERGRKEDALAEFEKMAGHDFADLPHDTNYLVALSYLARASAFLGDTRRAAALYRALLPYQTRNLTQTTVIPCEGPAAHYLGVLAATMGRWDNAARHFEDAIEMSTRMGARPFAAFSQQEHAAVLIARGTARGRETALQLLDQAFPTAQALGMKRLVEKVLSLRDRCRASTASSERGDRRVSTTHHSLAAADAGIAGDTRPAAVPLAASSAPPPVPSPRVFVGRERELLVLRGGVEEAVAGRGRLLLLAGEPGIGKTRTCEELATYATGRGAQVVWGRCSEDAGAPAFWPWVQILRTATNLVDSDALRRALGDGAPDVTQLMPEIRERLPDLAPATGVDSPQARFRLFDSIARLLEQLARRTPLVVIIDDLHGADQSSLLLVQFVVRALREWPLLLVGAYRDATLTREHPLTDLFVEALRQPGTERLTLSGLSPEEVERFIEFTAAVKPSAAVVAAIHQQTEGNPLFVAEYVRLLLADPSQSGLHTAPATLSVPQSVKAVIGRRLMPLSRECNAVLDVASVIGREFGMDVLERAVAALKGAGETRRAEPLQDVVREAVAARVVVEVPGPSRRYRFAHALIREALYDELRPSRRTQLHRQVGEAIERLPDLEEHLAELAHHFFEASRADSFDHAQNGLSRSSSNDAAQAVRYARRAGDLALALLAYEEAVRLYQLALQALQHAAPIDEGACCELLLSLADARRRAGQRVLARQTYQQAAEIARKLRRPDALARAALGDAIEGFVAGTRDEALIRLLEEAFGVLGEQDSVLKATVAAQLATALAADGTAQSDRSAQLSEQAVAIARRMGNVTALAEALLGRHWVLGSSPNMEERLAVSTEALRVAADTGDPGLVMSCRELRVRDLLELGDIDALNREIEAQDRDAQRLRQPVWLGQVTHLRAVRALLAGRLDECERLALEGFAIAQHVNLEGGLQLIGAQLFQVRREQGRLDEVEPAVRANADKYPGAVGFRCALAYVLVELNREAEAGNEFERIAADDFAVLRQAGAANLNVGFLAEVCAFLGDAQRAQTLYEFLMPYAGRNIVTPFSFICFGCASHPLGLLAATMQRWDEATRHFEDALRMYRKMGAPLLMARTQFEYARMLLDRRAAGDREQALDLLNVALLTARELGMKGLEGKVSGLLSLVSGLEESAQRSALSNLQPETRNQKPETRDQQPETNVFRQEGDYWTITHDGVVVRLKDSKGLQYIAYLLHHPGQQVHTLDLVRAVSGEARRVAANERFATTSAGLPLLDAQTKVAYRRRLEDLRETLAEAEGLNDLGRAARAREEIEALGEQLAAAVGLGGRDRPAAAAAERARLAVTKAIKSTIRKLRAANPTLARHLAIAITTGSLCGYAPDPDAIVSWLF